MSVDTCPKCGMAGGKYVTHACSPLVTPIKTTVFPPGGWRQTPWGTWEWSPWS